MKLQPIETAPTDGTYLLLFGDSGCLGTALRCEVGCWSDDKQRWDNHANNAFTDGGEEPTHWCPLPDGFETECQPKSLERLRYERWLKICKAGLSHTSMWNDRRGIYKDPAKLSDEEFNYLFTESLENHKERLEIQRHLQMANELVESLIRKYPDAINCFTFSTLLEHRIPSGQLSSRVLRIPEEKCTRRLRREIMTTAKDLIERKARHTAYLATLAASETEE